MLVTKQKYRIILIFISLSLCINSRQSACGKGEYKDKNGSCQICAAGTYNSRDDSDNCQACPNGTWNWGYTKEFRIGCHGCGKGSFINQHKQCETCHQGSYNDQDTEDNCQACPNGTWNWYFSPDHRIRCSGCGKGKFLLGNKICWDCASGEFNTQENATSCTKVPPGFKYTNTQSEPTKCSDGLYSAGGIGECVACPQNDCSRVEISEKTKKDILKLIKLSNYAYDIEYDADKSKHQLDEMEVVNNAKLLTRVLTGFDKSLNSIVVSYRGTTNFENQKSDLKIFQDSLDLPNCTGCKVHSGFNEGYYEMDSELQKHLDKLMSNHLGANIIVTGHSYGGAMASIKAVNLESKGIPVSLVTFGSPRVGNKEFSEFANSKISGMNLRITYQEDPVISFPPTILGYRHLGNEVQFYNNDKFYVFPKFLDRENNLDSINLNSHSGYWDIGEATQTPPESKALIYLID